MGRPSSTVRSAEALAEWTAWSERPLVVASLAGLSSYVFVFLAYDWRPFAAGAVALDLASWIAFALVWLAQLRVAPDRGALLRERKVLTLIALTGPFSAVLTVLDLLPAAVLVLRVLRVVPLARWFLRRRSLVYPALFGGVILLVAAFGFSRIEGRSFGEALYWSAATVSIGPQGVAATRPITDVLTIVLAFLGLGFFGAVVGSLTAAVMQREQDQAIEDAIGEAIDEARHLDAAADADLAAALAAISARLDDIERRLTPGA